MQESNVRDSSISRQSNDGISPWVWVMLGLLVILALAVVFVLPGMVDRYELPLTQRVQSQSSEATAAVQTLPTATQISPFDEAQRARLRRQAQDALASLLTRQARLDDKRVSEWGQDAYEQALATAREGDEHYRSGEFDQALAAYEQGDQLLGELLDEVPQVHDRLLAEGHEAIDAVDPERAEALFRLALRLDPESQAADAGLARAINLEEVTALVRRAMELRERQELERARDELREATVLDPEHVQASEMLAETNAMIRDANFSRAMSRGLALMQDGRADEAIAQFEQALRIRPGSSQAEEAIRQTREQATNATIAGHRSRAEQYEKDENWPAAIAEYEAALALDSNLVFASEGLDYSERRLQLDDLLVQTINEPYRLAEPEVYDYTVRLFQTGSALDEKGPRLREQLTRVEALLDQAQVPVEVELVSDNATRVTLYTVGELGQFSSRSVSLKPGRYVAVGTRPGYRDVREEFLVGFGNDPGPVTVQCQERVAVANRR